MPKPKTDKKFKTGTVYEVVKTTYGITLCARCFGAKTEQQKIAHNRYITETCPRCKGEGREQIKHETRVSLQQALKELNLIK